jgi:hypothetical protein
LAQLDALFGASLTLEAADLAVLTEDQDKHLTTGTTPLILDLDGNGVSTLSLEQGVVFDLRGLDSPVLTGWVGSGDALLVRDLNGNGRIDSGTELFGSATQLPDGSRAPDGFVALAALDANGDGLVNSADPAFAELQVWVDDGDGVTEDGELLSLAAAGVASLEVNPAVVDIPSAGNRIGLLASFHTMDGQVRDLADVWFRVAAVPAGEVEVITNAPPVDVKVVGTPAEPDGPPGG